MKLLHNRWFHRTLLICANLIFVASIVKSSRLVGIDDASSDPSIRIPSNNAKEAFPPLRKPSRIVRVDGKDLMTRVGYTAKPRLLGYYFSNSTTSSHLGVQVLPTNVPRRLTHTPVKVPAERLKAQRHLLDSEDYEDGQRDPLEHDDCVAQHDWMLQSFPTCNTIHESDLTNLHALRREDELVRLIGHGYWRDVWRIKNDEKTESVVLKTLRYQHDFEDRNYDRHRRDAVAMDRLSWSENIMDIYHFCGNTGIFEYAPGGDIEDMIWSDSKKVTPWNSTERLVVAYQVAVAIADAHDSERNGKNTIAHSDITTSQFVFVDGRYKLNDFNRCRFIPIHKSNGLNCKFEVGNNPGNFRAPEEYAYELESEKIDIYSMGNIMYVLLTNEWPFEDVEKEKEVHRKVMKGVRPTVKKEIRESEDPAHTALLTVMHKCWAQDPDDRPTAREMASLISEELRRLGIHDD